MPKKIVKFFIPSKTSEQGLAEVTNYPRKQFSAPNDLSIGMEDLNKSDYLYEMVILFLLKKADTNPDFSSKKRILSKIKSINKLLDMINMFEISCENDEELLAEIYDFSKEIASWCSEQGIFDYEEED